MRPSLNCSSQFRQCVLATFFLIVGSSLIPMPIIPYFRENELENFPKFSKSSQVRNPHINHLSYINAVVGNRTGDGAADPPRTLNHGIHRIHGKIGEPCRGGDVENWGVISHKEQEKQEMIRAFYYGVSPHDIPSADGWIE